MSIHYNPVAYGNTDNPPHIQLPYRLDPPVTNITSSEPTPTLTAWGNSFHNFFNRINKRLVLAAWFTYILLSAFMARPTASWAGSPTFFALGMALISFLALRGRLPSMFLSLILAISVLPLNPGIPEIPNLIYILVFIEAIRRRIGVSGGSQRVTFRGENGLASLSESMTSTWGIAGGHVGNNRDFGDMAAVGAQGEVAMGKALDKLSRKYPAVRVFHGLCFTPDKPGADIDHVVLIGHEVFLIDSKNWVYGEYTWTRDGMVLRDGSTFAGGDVHMDAALEKWENYFRRNTTSQARLTARITVTKPTYGHNGSYTLVNGRDRAITLTDIAGLVEELESVIAVQEPLVDRRLVYLIARQLQK